MTFPEDLKVQPDIPDINECRIEALHESGLLRLASSDQAIYDYYTRLVSDLLEVPVSLISLVDSDRQVFISKCVPDGPLKSLNGTCLRKSLCKLVVDAGATVKITNTQESEAVSEPGVFVDTGIIGYLGSPLITNEGHVLGALCAIDQMPRQWTAKEILILEAMARSIMLECRLRLKGNKLEELNARLESALHHKSDFLANMSHELRNPLNAVIGFSQILANHELQPTLREAVGIINASANHLHTLINDVLEMSKIDSGVVEVAEEDFEIRRLAGDVIEMFQLSAAGKDILLELEFNSECPTWMSGDCQKVRQILINLVGNAVKFTDRGGVTLRIEDDEMEPSCRLGESHQGTRLRFVISDTGPGLEKEEIDWLFVPFHQTKTGAKHPGGTGLGLAISQKFAQLLGGNIIAESPGKEGSTFSFSLGFKPAEASHVKAAKPLLPSNGRFDFGGVERKILIVDDIRVNRVLLKTLLSDSPFDFKEAENGAVAVEIAQAWCPDLILMDIKMPVMNGLDATRMIKSSMANPPVVVAVTGNAFDVDRERILAGGCDAFIRKPYQSSEIFDTIDRLLSVSLIS
ncbi:MAG: response regulator [Verrucomicrobiae bacterium]|nr:response regulator [Verrucomicrobiae bacterium]